MTSSSLQSALPRVTFTAKFLATAKPGRDANGEPRYKEYRDAISLLRWAVQPSGHGSPIIRYRRPGTGKSAKLTFDHKLSLAALRHAAAAAVVQIEQGTDPSPPRVAAAAKPAQADNETSRRRSSCSWSCTPGAGIGRAPSRALSGSSAGWSCRHGGGARSTASAVGM